MEELWVWTHGWHLATSQTCGVGRGISAQEAGCQACSGCCYFPAAQKFFVLKRVSLSLERLRKGYLSPFLARRAETILTVTTLLDKTRSERHP